jgi:hypothetical protein
LVQLKDNILNTYNNLNDLLYILTDNVYKYVSTENKTDDYDKAFWDFLENYSQTTRFNSLNVNKDILDNFFNALHILVESCQNERISSLARFVNGHISLI